MSFIMKAPLASQDTAAAHSGTGPLPRQNSSAIASALVRSPAEILLRTSETTAADKGSTTESNKKGRMDTLTPSALIFADYFVDVVLSFRIGRKALIAIHRAWSGVIR